MVEITKWIEDWFFNQLNDEWEHGFGIEIRTLDNPGWSIKVDLVDTPFENISMESLYVENSEDDWYSIEVNEGVYKGYGDALKLDFLLRNFREFISSHG